MKKHILTLIAVTAVLFTACKKDDTNKPGNDDATSATYQPTTTGSTWTYRSATTGLGDGPNAEVETTVNTMTATKKVFNGVTYQLAQSVTGTDNDEAYFGYKDHVYYIRSVMAGGEGDLDLPYLNDNLAVNGTWTLPVQVDDGPETKVVGTILEKDITKKVLDKTYNNVIHSKLEVQAKVDGNFVTVVTMEFYAAKGVGLIGIYTSFLGSETKSELVNHNVK